MDEVLKDEQLSVEWEAAEVLLIARSGASDPFQVKMRLKIAASDEDSGKQTDGTEQRGLYDAVIVTKSLCYRFAAYAARFDSPAVEQTHCSTPSTVPCR